MIRSRIKTRVQHNATSHGFISVAGLAFALLTATSAISNASVPPQVATPRPSPSPVEIRTLTPNAVVHERLAAGVTHVYELRLDQQQFAQISVDQRDLDLKLTATGPTGSAFSIEVDSPNGFFGPETVSLLAPVAGNYRIELTFSSTVYYPPGDYELRVSGPRAKTDSDEMRVAAERAFAQGQALRRDFPAQAIEKYNEALSLWRSVDDRRQQGYALTNIGRSYTPLRQLSQAMQQFNQALTLLREANDLPGQAMALNEAGAAQREFGDPREAIAYYNTALTIRMTLGDRRGQAQIYNNLGLTYSNMGYQPRSVENNEKALAIWRELKVLHHEMNTLGNAAKASVEMGDLELARSQYQRLFNLSISELSNDKSTVKNTARRLRPTALNGLGLVADTLADTDSALANYHEALELFRENEDKIGEADVLDNIGMTYAFLGDVTQAIDYFRQALALREISRQPRSWGMTLSNLGYAYALLRDNIQAREKLEQALSLSQRSRDRRFEAYSFVRLGMTYVAPPLPQPLKALEYYEQALAIQQEPGFEDRRGQAITLDKIAEALRVSGQETAALKKYEEAIQLWQAVGDGQGQALSLFGIARIERDRLNLANARDRVEEAIEIIEKLRHTVTGRQLQMIYFEGKQDLYALAIDVRMQLYEAKKSQVDLEAAVAFSEKARARNLLDLLSEAKADLYKDLPPKIADRIRLLDRQISELTQNLIRFRGMNAKQDIATIQQKLNGHINDYDRLLAPFKKTRNREAQPLSAKQIQQLLDDDMLLLQFSLGEKRSHLWAITKTTIDPYTLPSGEEINKTANKLRQALIDKEPARERESFEEITNRRQSATARYRRSAAHLSRMLFTEVAPNLGNKRLVIVADGSLHYVPFEALPFPEPLATGQSASPSAKTPLLLLNNEIVYQPSASALAMLRRTRRPVASKKVAILADPIFNTNDASAVRGKTGFRSTQFSQSTLTRSLRDIGDVGSGDYVLQRLEFSLKEANEIAKVAPRGSLKAVQFKASRTLATSPILKQFGFVHFATHGILNEKNPELSGIVLSMVNERGRPDDGYLTLRDIYNLDLPAYLVVLSACETGVSTPIRGEGLIGLSRGFMNAGARSVVVSLWRVEDAATAELMKRFYTNMFGDKRMSPAAALRQAKIEMTVDYHPYQWAGFILQGDWK